MNTLDIILSALLIIGVVRGFLHGFIHEIAVLAIIFLCYFFGFRLSGVAGDFLNSFLNFDPDTMYIASLLVGFLGISIGIYFLSKLLEGLINIVALGPLNKIAGGLFGGLKYAIVISLVLYFLNKVNMPFEWFNSDAKANSVLYYKILNISGWII